MSPAVHRAAMMVVVELAFEAVQHVEHPSEPGGFKGVAGIDRAISAAADQHHRTIPGMAGELLHFPYEVGVDFPVGAVIPRDVADAGRMPDEEEFHFTTTIDKQGAGSLAQELGGFLGGQVFDGSTSCRAALEGSERASRAWQYI